MPANPMTTPPGPGHHQFTVLLHHSKARGTAKVVLLGIAHHQEFEGEDPTVATLAKYASVHPRNVTEALKTLQALGELVVDSPAPGLSRPNRYEVRLGCPEDCDRTEDHVIEGERISRSFKGSRPAGSE